MTTRNRPERFDVNEFAREELRRSQERKQAIQRGGQFPTGAERLQAALDRRRLRKGHRDQGYQNGGSSQGEPQLFCSI